VGSCLDLGHANLCESTRNNYLRYIDSLDGRVEIIHIHLHENYGDRDSHLPLFTGPAGKDSSGIGIDRPASSPQVCGRYNFEQWPDPPELLTEARERLLLLAKRPPYLLDALGER